MKNVLVTGASRGLGKCLVELFCHKGYFAIPHYRNKTEEGYRVSLVGDLSGQRFLSSLDDFLNTNTLSVFVNNAGVYTKGSFDDEDFLKLDEQIAVNFSGALKVIHKVYKHMKDKGSGIIVNISSLACSSPTPKEHLYGATKKALDHALQAIQIEAVGTGVQFLDVYLGATKTDMTRDRDDHASLCDPYEVAGTVTNLVDYNFMNSSCYVNEVTIRRS
jgi:short-subunit dehydrogenase